jgi:hypothetical protein
MTIRLSSLQYPMLEAFASGTYMSIGQAQVFDQRPFRSMLVRGWVAYRPGRGFHITSEGRAAHQDFHHRNIARKNPQAPLTRYFDPVAYGLHVAVSKPQAARGAA